MPRTSTPHDTSIRAYRAKRNFDVTSEPAPKTHAKTSAAPMFVVQKHAAHRAGLHWDFRLEHGGVLWSWAVRKGPSLDPADKRIAVHVEDHPLDYADFQGTIPDGEYGAGKVETWDRGTWEALDDPEAGMRDGELRFVLRGDRLNGRFTLVRLRPRPDQRGRQDNWLLIKGHDEAERAGADATAIEQAAPTQKAAGKRPAKPRNAAPAKGATRGKLPQQQAPQLAAPAEETPRGDGWLSEIKFDGYRLLCWVDRGKVRLVTRSGLDWTDRFPAVAREVGRLGMDTALLDGELVALDKSGASSFPMLQAALSNGRDGTLSLYLFDILHLDGWDLRPCRLADRKRVLSGLADWQGMLRYSDHHEGDPAELHARACEMKLEGTVCKQASAPYRAGRGHGWVKVKCLGREEFLVLGWTTPGGSRIGLGSLHLGYYDPQGGLHYAGGVGTGFSEQELARLSDQLADLAAETPKSLLLAGDPLPADIHWVRPDLVAEVQYANWSGSGRVRHAVYLGLREDKPATEVVREPADPAAERKMVKPRQAPGDATIAKPARRIVTARAPKGRGATVGGVALTHPERELWPGITKQELAKYWLAVAEHALPGLAHRPLAVVRCPSGIAGEHFFQKHGHGGMPPVIRDGEAGGSPYLVIDGADGLVAMAQMSAIELHAWGATEADPLHPDLMVFDLDPGEGVPFVNVVKAAHDVRDHLRRHGLESFCRTTGGKGLHVVVPIQPEGDWDTVKPFCRAFAETMSQEKPDAYLPTLKKEDRRGKILIDWLRNGLGATAVASFCPRARPGATVATPVAWDEVTDRLDPTKFTLRTVTNRLVRLNEDPWAGFSSLRQRLPDLASRPATRGSGRAGAGKSMIVRAAKPERRRS
jgi:bifunctional non-homologous end joining protein LigD